MKIGKLRLIVLAVFALIGFLDAGFRLLRPWTFPSGGGQYQPSPDGRYEFSASSLTDGVPWGRPYSYGEFTVRDLRTGQLIRTIRIPESENGAALDYREDSMVIQWSTDSSAVVVPIANGAELRIRVP